MQSIIDVMVRFRLLVLAVAALVAVAGADRMRRMPLDVLPELNPPIVEIQTEAPGLSANEVELMVSYGVEELVSGLPWVKTLKSDSVTGLSTVRLEFEPGTNLMRARQLVQERLTASFLLPNVAKPPVMQQPISSTNRIMMIALTSKELDSIRLSTLTTWTVKPRLLGVPGVANVSVWGDRRRQIQVQMDPEKMRANKIKQNQVIASTGDALWMSPLSFLKSSVPGTGGWIETPNQRLEIRHVLPMSSAQDIAGIGIDGTRLKLGDVAKVVEGHPPLIGDAVVPEGNGLLLVVEKFPGTDTVEVTRAVEEAVNGLRPGLQGVDIDVQGFRPASFVEWSVANVANLAMLAGSLVLFGLGAMLFQWRAPLIAIVSIALSTLAAAFVLHLQGAGLNLLVLTGLAAAVACLIDDVVVTTESLFRHIRGERTNQRPVSVRSAIRASAAEARGPLGYALLIALLLVLPAFLLEGLDAAMAVPIVKAYALALLASAVTVLTVVPALVSLLYDPARVGPAQTAGAPIARLSSSLLDGTVRTGVGASGIAIATMCALAVAALPVLPKLRNALTSVAGSLPQFSERDLVIQFDGPGGASHPEMMRLTTSLLRDVRAVPGVRRAYAHIGRAIGGDQIVNVNSSRIWVSVNSSADHARVHGDIRKLLEGYPEMNRRMRTYLGERLGIDASGSRHVTARIYGQRLEDLRALARQAKERIGRIDGLGAVRIDDLVEEDQLHVTVDLDAAAKFGLKPGDVRRAAATHFSGLEVGRIFEAQKVFEVVVWSMPETRRNIESLADAPVELPAGGHVRLGEVAKVTMKPTPSLIKREGVSLYLDVVVDVGNRPVSAATTEIGAAMKEIVYPLGYYPVVNGDMRGGATLRPALALLGAAIGILLVIQACLGSWPLGLATFCLLPLMSAGSLVAAGMLRLPISLGVLVGLVAVLSLAARLLLTMMRHLQVSDLGGDAMQRSAAVASAASERLAPILLTVVCTALAMLPAVYMSSEPGLELLYPMTVAILGGLVSSMLVLVLAAPWVYLRFADLGLASLEPEVAR